MGPTCQQHKDKHGLLLLNGSNQPGTWWPVGPNRAGRVYETRLRINVYEMPKGDEFRKLATTFFPGAGPTGF